MSEEIKEEAKEELPSITLDQAAAGFERDLDTVFKMIDVSSKNSLQRVLKKLLAHPFHEDKIALGSGDAEKELFERGITVAAFKMYMTMEYLKQDAMENKTFETEGETGE